MAIATLPWIRPLPLPARVDLGPGLEPELLTAALRRLCGVAGVKAVIAYGSRGRGDAQAESDLDLAVICAEAHLTPEMKLERWRQCREALGLLGRGVDLVVQGQADAERLAGSRWHDLSELALLAGVALEPALLALQTFAVEARYEEGPFPLPAPREELVARIEQLLGGCEKAIEAAGGRQPGNR